MLASFADQIIQKMEQNYDTIANHFSDTRHAAWPEFESLKTLIKSENTENLELLDIGCGNGRLAEAIPVVHYTGLDLSRQLLILAQQHFPQYTFIHGSMLQLPFADQQFDLVACVAALQHIPSVAYREIAMQEMARVLKPGGIIFMLNWNLYQEKLPNYFVHDPRYDEGDTLVPWKNDQGEVLAQRYYHGFRIAELNELAEHAGLKVLSNELGSDHRNIITIAEKR